MGVIRGSLTEKVRGIYVKNLKEVKEEHTDI